MGCKSLFLVKNNRNGNAFPVSIYVYILTEREPTHARYLPRAQSSTKTIGAVVFINKEPVIYESVSQLSNLSVHHRSEMVPGLPVAP